ncbi:CMP-N-acetylneuraminate-poly-alpha-2,8-sialyltransferase-like [Ptychodera flava]|uniref:CMP-N-acetylneuraminate-poly-alpha-2, 8-sialyltransferase-like n=1 Tax=Ptychodera flava TaxID=63121 RepID=UPI00396A2A5D
MHRCLQSFRFPSLRACFLICTFALATCYALVLIGYQIQRLAQVRTHHHNTEKLHHFQRFVDEMRPFYNEMYGNEFIKPGYPQRAQSLTELRDEVSRNLDLENSMAVFRRHVRRIDMDFPQNFWPQGKPPMGKYRLQYDELFETIAAQNRCALVGSGGILRNSTCGKEIDDHDFIMRVNLATVQGYEVDVGSKTHLVAVNNLVVTYLSKYFSAEKSMQSTHPHRRYVDVISSMNDTILWFPYNMSWTDIVMKDAKANLYKLLKHMRSSQFKYRVAYSPAPLYPQKINRFWNKSTTSEGFLLFTIATLFCDRIDLYGFWPHAQDLHGNNVTHHYYDSTTLHRKTIPNEFKILSRYNSTGVIRLVADKCDG